ncbi:DUF4352 domain-containing protein [Dactylosporangium sp. NPDC051541]|uniref:DUF4352 domain-containing protein n=1 Tax=Dactylosporangium sp. NPDC051541 TaxID=3363977 RepID=UPI0037A6591E
MTLNDGFLLVTLVDGCRRWRNCQSRPPAAPALSPGEPMRFRVFAAVAAAPLAGLVLACGAGTSGTSTSGDAAPAATTQAVTTVKVGEVLNLTEDMFGSKTRVAITLTNVRAVKPSNQFDKPDNGQYIVADVAVVVNEGKFSISSGSFKLVAADGNAYNSTFMTGLKDLSGQDLTPGQKTSGSVAFDTAKGAEKGGRIALTNMLASGDAGYWTL